MQAPLGPVAHDRAADAARRGEADADEIGAIVPMAGLGADGAAGARPPAGSREKVRTLFQSVDGQDAHARRGSW
jgi:hypothetical protein